MKWVVVWRRCSESLQREERNVRRVPKRCQVSKSGDFQSLTRSQVENNVVGKAVRGPGEFPVRCRDCMNPSSHGREAGRWNEERSRAWTVTVKLLRRPASK